MKSSDDAVQRDAPEDVARLVQEVLANCGWDGDAAKIAENVRRLDIGLSAEDEFSVLCAWLGKCELLHKLDQVQIPIASKEKYQVPDLLARFSTQTNERPVLIEVKSKDENTLSFTPAYLQRLQNYADLMGMPLLIAWRRPSFNMWVLFEAKHFKKKAKNYNINIFEAMKNSLLSTLVGDFAYKVVPGTTLHLRFRKQNLVSVQEGAFEEGWIEKWQMTFDDIHFTNTAGERVELPTNVQSLFAAWDLEDEEEHSASHIRQTFIAQDVLQYAHRVLGRLLQWESMDEKQVKWRQLLEKRKILRTIENVYETVEEAKKLNIVEGASFIIVPHDVPDFMK